MNDNVKQTEWGVEVTWAKKDDYCAKILVFTNAGSRTPFYFHNKKNKTWFVNNGHFKIRYIDTTNGQIFETSLTEGQVFDVPALMPCSIEALKEGSSLAESSNGEFENDMHIIFRSELIGK